MIKEISKKEFKEKYPEIDTYWTNHADIPVFLENGIILSQSDWNGEVYIVNGKWYRPVEKETECGDFETIGYEEEI